MTVKQIKKFLEAGVLKYKSENKLAKKLDTSAGTIRHHMDKDQGKGKEITSIDLLILKRLQNRLGLPDDKFWHPISGELDKILQQRVKDDD